MFYYLVTLFQSENRIKATVGLSEVGRPAEGDCVQSQLLDGLGGRGHGGPQRLGVGHHWGKLPLYSLSTLTTLLLSLQLLFLVVGVSLNMMAIKILVMRKQRSLFNYLLIGLLATETGYLLITMLQFLYTKILVI